MNPFLIISLITKGMDITQKILAGKSKQEKIDNAVSEATDMLQFIEGVTNKDLLRDERLQPFIEKYATATKDLVNEIKKIQAELPADIQGLKP